ncbi:spore coat protein [Motilibacter aurantiacus]|uniref:spore coat protein n=1 Tax=Motilibacter aurantiacus TaxID=2714955 RepID=UPI00140AD807|nr:spore coat protein [Motilibacter aurantiacus]NHC46378.1 spore coat protein [Motilibacter aurantiacus]
MSGPVVAVRCDASASGGVGHVMRSAALSEALLAQGLGVVFLGDLHGVALAERRLRALGVEARPAPAGPAEVVATLDRVDAAAVVIDSYSVPPEVHAAVRRSGRVVAAIVDAAAPGLEADLVVNQNHGAEHLPRDGYRGRLLAGARYALLPRRVTLRRPPAPPPAPPVARRALVVLGGTDAAHAAADVAERLLGTGMAAHLDVVCATEQLRRRVQSLPVAAGRSVAAHAPVDDLAGLATEADLVISAAGTTVWELACLGRAVALVPVADNQLPGYTALVRSDVCHGLGPAARLRQEPAAVTAELAELMSDQGRRERLSTAAYSLVDGAGSDRVAAELAVLLRTTASNSSTREGETS